jgi:hypothetical protein
MPEPHDHVPLPVGNRHDDPPDKAYGFRARLAIVKYPIYVGMTISMLVAAVALGLVLKQQGSLQAQKLNVSTARTASLGFCRALQRQRERENRTSAAVYLTLAVSGARESKLAKTVRDPKTRALHESSSRALILLANTSRYTDPTNCKRAVDDPSNYKAPTPVPYTLKKAQDQIPGIAKLLKAATDGR